MPDPLRKKNNRLFFYNRLTKAKDISHLPVNLKEMEKTIRQYPFCVSPYFLSLVKYANDPIWKQAIPSIQELHDTAAPDPLCETEQSPVPGIIHRYPDRVVLLAENRCFMLCRHCMRKNMPWHGKRQKEVLAGCINYIKKTPSVFEVILSGGDPLVMEDSRLFNLLSELCKIPHVKVLRIHTRAPSALPGRITRKLADGLKEFQPLYINIQFNHPSEITPESTRACRMLADAGTAPGSQTVLLKGVNDDYKTLKKLFTGLLEIRVKPYYLHQLDKVKGVSHFHVPIIKGISIMESLRGNISGMAIPQYMIDIPGGGGKAEIMAGKKSDNGKIQVKNFKGKVFEISTG